MPRCTIGIDFGTESARAVVVDMETGRQLGTAIAAYASGVIDRQLHVNGQSIDLEPGTALQDPHDYVESLGSVVRGALKEAGVRSDDVGGLGISFTSCTVMPVNSEGLPLCAIPTLRPDPHAWVKLWKHHTAQREADDIDRHAREEKVEWIARYGGRTSCEWYFPKLLETYRKSPGVYEATHRYVEAGDWLVWQLTDNEHASGCTAGYKAAWSADKGFPDADFWRCVERDFDPSGKLPTQVVSLGGKAGVLTSHGAALTGLVPGTPIAPAVIDAHASVCGAGVVHPGSLVLIMGTSLCHMLLHDRFVAVPGIAGAVRDGIVPGLVGYEAGQPALGDLLAWVRRLTGKTFAELEQGAARRDPGECGLLALDWFNGNRSVLDDAGLSGLVVGLTLATGPEDIYRGLMEAAAFGTRIIVEALSEAGLAADRLVACGGITRRSPLMVQIFSDVLGKPLEIAVADETSALGAAIYGAVAAGTSMGGFDTFEAAVEKLVEPPTKTISPDLQHHATYQQLFARYRQVYDYFGRNEGVMAELQRIRSGTSDAVITAT